MTFAQDVSAIQRCVTNALAPSDLGTKQIAGIIGDAPSLYSKSPKLWNAVFNHLGIEAIYLPFDVAPSRLGELLAVLKRSDAVLGFNVTVPHKVAVMDLLDEIDPAAKRIQAVNTVVRTSSGQLVGYNTDGEGFIQSLITRLPGHPQPFMASLENSDVLLLGSGGSARAVAFHLSDLLGHGRVIIANRTLEHAVSLSKDLRQHGRKAHAIDEAEVATWARKASLIVNSTTKGQGGIRKSPDGTLTVMEQYSALASAHPRPINQSDFNNPLTRQNWQHSVQPDIDANNQASLTLAQSIPPNVHFYDLIYHPEETVFLRHAQKTGHPTQNGQAMIICQAAIAFCRHICKQHLIEAGKASTDSYEAVTEVMAANW